MNDSNRKNGMAQTSNGPQWVKTDDKRIPNIFNPNPREVSPTFLGLKPVGFNASSFIPKSLSLKQASKGKKVLAKGRVASNISKTTVKSNHHKSASFTLTNHCASSSPWVPRWVITLGGLAVEVLQVVRVVVRITK